MRVPEARILDGKMRKRMGEARELDTNREGGREEDVERSVR
jgi:hypothetical protein